MKGKYLLFLLIILSNNLLAQSFTGINTISPKATLDINGNLIIREVTLGDSKNDVLTISKDGSVHKIPNEFQPPRILAGTIGSVFGKSSSASKTEKNQAAVDPIGGIAITKGLNYTISNPRNGYFIIVFDTPFANIYSASISMVDSYGSTGSSVPNGEQPNLDIVGLKLYTNDNTQIAFINIKELHVKTGNDSGVLQNRSFTFMVMGDNN
ncbi:hypothetical protein OIU80_11985 [Flavobacterium sp. LS1R47]|uniref:C1q domain-containing protein n=1 Tax=Flavobacterium frigoritolerans TaxID=2987686 RepID=A0A9X2ZQU3_9FLAO|nr:hypothetical protein [Flavobacterium frigoritolerans]MCV9933002.1 hypothetical protein [Flavobacterium frigoritolerans]